MVGVDLFGLPRGQVVVLFYFHHLDSFIDVMARVPCFVFPFILSLCIIMDGYIYMVDNFTYCIVPFFMDPKVMM